ncbi:MAG: NfeD family protein [Acholeplasmatales bacterium]|nr:NfeD family protein [Acholeplasmatales bacterium]
MLLAMSLNTAMIFVWLGIAIVALVVELNTTDLSSIWATVGGAITAIVAIWCHIIWVQIIVFLVISILGIVLIRPYVKRYVKRNEIETNVDSLIGKKAICVDDIAPDNVGACKIDGKVWSAIAKDDTITINVGQKVEILSIDGVKLIVKPVDNKNNEGEN